MRARPIACFALLLIVAFAGCAQSPNPSGALAARPSSAAPYAPATFSEDTGGLEGLVTDDSALPLGGAQVQLPDLNLTAFSDEEGRFSFSLLAPGTHRIHAGLLGYESTQRSIDVRVGETTTTTIALAPLPILEAFHVTHEKAGRIGCAYAHRSATPVWPRSYTDACGHANRVSGVRVFNADFQIEFKLVNGNTSTLASLVLETTWRPNQASANGLDVPWGIGGSLYQFGEPTGKSPLRHVTNRTVIEQVADTYPTFCKWHGPCPLWGSTYPFPETLGSGYPADITFVVDQPFTHYATEFVFDEAPSDFTALPDS